jgi:hypothetical protein
VLLQSAGGNLVTLGSAGGFVNLGQRTFSAEFDASFSINNPGFNSLAAGNPNLPAGVGGLPGDTPLGWDFSPMRIGDMAANLFYWNGADSDGVPGFSANDVRFGATPSATYRLYMKSFDYFVDGADADVPGGVLVNKTAADGTMHVHEYFSINDGDGDGATDPFDGIYLMALRLRMPGLAASLPAYFVFGTLGSTVEALDKAAVPWVEDHADTLVLLGDYNKNGVVDAADYTVWRNTVGQTGFALPADGDASGTIDADDYSVWRDGYGKMSPTTLGGAGQAAALFVPEPPALLILLAGLVQGAKLRRRRRVTQCSQKARVAWTSGG